VKRTTPAPLPTGAEKVAAVDAMFDAIAPGYDVTNRVISLGLDTRWRRRTVRSLSLPAGSRVLDLACGTGDLSDELARQGLTAIGLDRSAGMLQAAGARAASARRPASTAAERGTAGATPPRSSAAPSPAPLVRGDGLDLPFRSGSLDGIVCGFALRNFAALPPVLSECARVLRAGGRIGLLEVDAPTQPLLRFGHQVWFGKVVPFIGGLVAARSGAPRARATAAYRYLPASVAYLPAPAELLALIASAGFISVERHPLTGGIAQLLTGIRS
jgi:demethylmenaquinone methyltransferase/2-methoxy-6-polyprenyl-1,4-benzoquinol methylase